LVDAGDERRLERFGARVVDRPAPSAIAGRRAASVAWANADLRFDRDAGWMGDPTPWTIDLEGLTLELRPTSAGQVGLFPEHPLLWPRLQDALDEMRVPGTVPSVLHLFASTGATSLELARSGASVVHVDASRPAVAWARRNATLSGLADRPVRWIVDDALEFVRREERRGRRYDGIVLDPPTWGHGPAGSRWQLRTTLPELLDAVASVAADRAVVVLTAHAAGLDPDDLAGALADAFPGPNAIAAEPLALTATSGAVLPLGSAARMIRG
ncbi:MAG TPA: RsmD family RNA methyltransferase, partial [Candidatus Limnocylindrales bacterium]